MKYIKEYNTYSEIKSICKKYGIRNYTINNDGSIDVGGGVNLINMYLKKLPLNFNRVTDDFHCSGNKLTSLKGCPKEVGGDFDCGGNKLTSLEGCPKTVGNHFDCSYNQLTSLEGCPEIIAGDFICSGNKLTSLEGLKSLGGGFYCLSNLLPKLIIDNLYYIKGIIKWQDDYSIWRKDGSLDEFRFNDMMIDIKNDYKI